MDLKEIEKKLVSNALEESGYIYEQWHTIVIGGRKFKVEVYLHNS